MAQGIEPTQDRIFAARPIPYRSLSPQAASRLIFGFGCVSALVSLPFFYIGAWPVVGFLGLDVLALSVAIKANFRAANAYENVLVTPLELELEQVSAKGLRRVWRFNPAWVRIEEETHDEIGTERIALVSRGESVEVGAFLGPAQKTELARNLAKALGEARRGARFG